MLRLLPLLLTVFIDSMGFGLIFPLLSPLIMEEGGILGPEVTLTMRGAVVGLLMSSFCIGQFFSGPVMGALSDRKGRKKILLLTLIFATGSYFIAATSVWVGSIALLFVARILAGISAGNYSIAQSIVVDMSPAEEKGKYFGVLGMSWGLGFIVGPLVGGMLSRGENWSMPFLFSGALCLLNMLLVKLVVKETLVVGKESKLSMRVAVDHLVCAFKHPVMKGLFVAMFIYSVGWGFFTELSPIYLMKNYLFTARELGNYYACVGIWVAISQGILIRPLLKRFKPGSLYLVGLLGMGLCLPLMLVPKTGAGLYYVIPLLAFSDALLQPTSMTLVSDMSSKDAQGEMLGVLFSIRWAAIGIAPFFSGSFVALFPPLPIYVGSVCMFVAFLVFLLFFRRRLAATEEA